MIRRSCALMGLLALFLQGSSGGHMLLVEHRQCAEHGELVHGGEAHHHDASAHAEADRLAFESGSKDASGEAHEHCALSLDRRDATPSIVQAKVALCPVEASPSATPDAPHTLGATERFRIAPKNSPPA
ncbi:MAG: hypothetical protein HKP36_20245 [Myxococcales bacterium]|nr:hypothetical protein [Deltaproteobacteria bacterium]NNL26771.1 hypothetical protein [Myxococcales bacterium]RZV50359.1 MAG: hypothetical protein EX268_17165 [Deltaproteobacteria bacterium]